MKLSGALAAWAKKQDACCTSCGCLCAFCTDTYSTKSTVSHKRISFKRRPVAVVSGRTSGTCPRNPSNQKWCKTPSTTKDSVQDHSRHVPLLHSMLNVALGRATTYVSIRGGTKGAVLSIEDASVTISNCMSSAHVSELHFTLHCPYTHANVEGTVVFSAISISTL